MGRRYEVAIINSIKKELAQGVPVKILSKKYNIEGRRIYEWKNETITLESSKAKNVSKTVDIEKTKNITSTSKKQLTIEEVMMNSGVNPNDWTVESASINNWDDSKGDTHYQTKLSLVRKNLDLSVELPSPINITIKGDNSKSPKVHSSIKCALILPDMQVGFRRNLQDGSLEPIHDRDAMNVALQIASFIQADRIVMLGDNLDLAEMSTKYLTTPEFYFTTQASIVELAWWLGKFRSVNFNTKIDYLAGNHEFRLEKYLNEKAIHAYGLKPATRTNGSSAISVEGLLGLNDLDIEYHPYPSGKVALNSNLVCIHGEVAKGQSGATVSEVVKSARVSTIQGHIHRHEIATKTTYDAFDNALEVTAASFGCLCSIDPGKVPGMKHLQNWQQGVGVVWYEDNGLEQFRVEFIPIIKGRAIYNQEVFESYESENIGINIQKETRFKVT